MEYEIKGGPFPILICKLKKGETMKNESGSMALMSSHIKMETSNGNTIIAQKHSYLASEKDVDISIHFKKKIGRGLFGGEGFILQKFTGNGMVFLEIDGEVLEYDLEVGESILIDQGHLAAMESTVDFDIERVKGAKNMLIGGEGLFFGKLTGPGKVWIQTMPISKLADALLPFIPTTNGGDV